MSGFGFLDEEINEAAAGAGTGRPAAGGSGAGGAARRQPPSQWSAARTKSQFEDQLHVADRAGPSGGGGGGGPSLPFRIREVQIIPKAIGTQPVFAVAKP